MTIHDLAEYEILDEHRVEDVQSDGFILRHKKSGARIAILSNNDDNKVFYIGFRTPPEDETGVPHIIEHTTLCEATIHPKEPMIFLNEDAVPGSTCLIWDHIEDAPGKPCPNPRVIMPRKVKKNIVNGVGEIDIRSFGIRTPPTTSDKPNYGKEF